MTPPRHGRTVSAHVEQSLTRAKSDLAAVSFHIRFKQLPKRDRIRLWRKLAGVVSDVESIRLWLECGAPK